MSGSILASSTGDGSNVTVTSTTQVSLMDYQCVTSHGNETVPDTASPTTVNHYPNRAVLTPFKWDSSTASTKKGSVHVPIHNPPAVVNRSMYLQNIIVKFDVTSDAVVNTVTLYYDSQSIVQTNMSKEGTFHIDFTTNEAQAYAYIVPAGISVQLDLRFPNEDSSINLYSVTLVYKATQG